MRSCCNIAGHEAQIILQSKLQSVRDLVLRPVLGTSSESQRNKILKYRCHFYNLVLEPSEENAKTTKLEPHIVRETLLKLHNLVDDMFDPLVPITDYLGYLNEYQHILKGDWWLLPHREGMEQLRQFTLFSYIYSDDSNMVGSSRILYRR